MEVVSVLINKEGSSICPSLLLAQEINAANFNSITTTCPPCREEQSALAYHLECTPYIRNPIPFYHHRPIPAYQYNVHVDLIQLNGVV